MSNAQFQLEIVTPTKVIDCGQVSYLRAPGEDGLFGVLAHHTRAMVALAVGELKYTSDGKEHFYATNGGFADIQAGNVQLLLETAETFSEIDKDRAASAAKRARERLTERSAEVDLIRAEAALQRATNRLGILTRHR
ncbi:F0F1 ATP synthase subunit epsilon [Candidatus Neomarinimicrobiota bacterium]